MDTVLPMACQYQQSKNIGVLVSSTFCVCWNLASSCVCVFLLYMEAMWNFSAFYMIACTIILCSVILYMYDIEFTSDCLKLKEFKLFFVDHSSQSHAIAVRSRWSGAERRSDATELPVRRVFSSRQIAAAVAVEVQKPAVQGCRGPVFVDLNMGLGLLLSVLFLSINRSLSPLTPLILWRSFNLRQQRDRWLWDQ